MAVFINWVVYSIFHRLDSNGGTINSDREGEKGFNRTKDGWFQLSDEVPESSKIKVSAFKKDQPCERAMHGIQMVEGCS